MSDEENLTAYRAALQVAIDREKLTYRGADARCGVSLGLTAKIMRGARGVGLDVARQYRDGLGVPIAILTGEPESGHGAGDTDPAPASARDHRAAG